MSSEEVAEFPLGSYEAGRDCADNAVGLPLGRRIRGFEELGYRYVTFQIA